MGRRRRFHGCLTRFCGNGRRLKRIRYPNHRFLGGALYCSANSLRHSVPLSERAQRQVLPASKSYLGPINHVHAMWCHIGSCTPAEPQGLDRPSSPVFSDRARRPTKSFHPTSSQRSPHHPVRSERAGRAGGARRNAPGRRPGAVCPGSGPERSAAPRRTARPVRSRQRSASYGPSDPPDALVAGAAQVPRCSPTQIALIRTHRSRDRVSKNGEPT